MASAMKFYYYSKKPAARTMSSSVSTSDNRLEEFKRRFRRSGSLGIPFVPEEDIRELFTEKLAFLRESNCPESEESEGHPILTIIVRSARAVDGISDLLCNMPIGTNGEPQTMTIKAFNEWDSSQSGGVDWRTKLDVQKGAVLATEIKNNSCKLGKWTVQALLANSDILKFGYVSRASVRNSAQHVILGTQQHKPSEFAVNISLNMDNAWGVLRCIIDRYVDWG